MKKRYLIDSAIALAILTSCSDDIADVYTPSSHLISYAVETVASPQSRSVDSLVFTNTVTGEKMYATITEIPTEQTRAAAIETADKVTDLHMTAFYIPSGSSKRNLLFDESLASSNNWATSQSYYWPASGKMEFVAYTPNEAITYDKDNLTLTYTVPDDVEAQEDILYTHLTGTESSLSATDGTLGLPLYHACSRLIFTLGESLPTGVIQSIKLTNIKTKGTFNLSKYSWTLDEESVNDITLSDLAQPTEVADETVTTLDDEKTLMLLPQSGSEVNLTINVGYYKTYYDETNTLVYEITNSEDWESTIDAEDFNLVQGKSYYIKIVAQSVPSTTAEEASDVVYEEFDSYYFIKKYTFNVKAGATHWKITSNSSWLTFRTDQGQYAKYGFWVEDEKGSHTVEGDVTASDESQVVTVYAYCPENISTSSRDATVMLIEDGKLSDCKFMRQLAPISAGTSYYTANTDYGTVSSWGYYDGWGTLVFSADKSKVDFSSLIDTSWMTGLWSSYSTRPIVIDSTNNTLTINFSFTPYFVYTVNGTNSGQTNTNNLFYNIDKSHTKDGYGYWYMMQMALAMSEHPDVTCTSGNVNTFLDSALMRAIQYNQFYLVEKYGVQVPELDSIKWTLPGSGETAGFSSAGTGYSYWCSTGFTNSRAYSYKNGSETTVSRNTANYYVRAIRYK